MLVHDPLLQEDAASFRAWSSFLTPEMLRSKSWVQSLLDMAREATDQAEHKAAAVAIKRFAEWVKEGQAAGLRRQHLFARTAAGWTQDAGDKQQPTKFSKLDDFEGISESQLRAAVEPSEVAGTPIGPQFTANVERARWGEHWAVDATPDDLQWPDQVAPLTPVS